MWRKFSDIARNLMGFLTRFPVDHPIPVILFTVIMTLALGVKIFPLNIRGFDVIKELPQNERIIQDTYFIDETFGARELIIVGLESENIFTIENLRKTFAITEEVSNIDGVAKTGIVSLATFQEIKIREDGRIEITPLVERLPQSQEDLEALRNKVLSNGLVYGKIVSRDGTSTLIVIPLEPNYDQKEIYQNLSRIRDKYQDSETPIYLSGRAIAGESLEEGIGKDLIFLIPMAFLAVTVFFFLSLRRLLLASLPLSAILLSVLWSFGIMGYFGVGITLVSSAMPLLIIAVAGSYGIHLILRYYDGLRSGKEKKEAIVATLQKTGPAIVLAGITSALGFGTLYIFKILSIREFAIITAVGIMIAVFLSLTWVPAWLSLLKAPSYMKKDAGFLKGVIDRFDLVVTKFLKILTRFVFSHRYIILLVALAGPTFLALTGIPKIQTKLDVESFFPKGHEYIKVEGFMEERFNWNAEIVVMVDSGQENSLKDPENLLTLWQFQKEIDKLDGVSGSDSFIDILNEILKDNPQVAFSDPQNLLNFIIESGYFSDQITKDGRSLKIDVRANLNDVNDARFLEKNIRELSGRYFGANYDLHFSSEDSVLSLMNGYIVTGKTQNMVLSVIIVGLVCSFIFRVKRWGLAKNTLGSLGFGILSVLPLTVSTLAVFGIMGWMGISFNMVTAVISGIAVGVGVDFAIHYLHRVRELNGRDSISPKSLEEVTALAARPILYNALSNIAGFSVFIFSGFVPLNQLGLLMMLIMATCFLGTMLILPILLSIFSKKVSV